MPSPETDARAARLALDRLLETDAPLADALERFVALLLAANGRLNLTRVVEPDAVARLHLLDALVALPLVDAVSPKRAADLGSGGGVPGLVLALARPSVRWTMVESVGKKAAVLREFASELGLANVEVRADRAEALGHEAGVRESFDLVTARACAALPVLAEYALPLLTVNGTLVAWKGPIADDEMRAGAAAAGLLGGGAPVVEPAGRDELGDHRFVLIRKERPTPEGYPRRPGVPARRPLPG